MNYDSVCGEAESVTVIEKSKFVCYLKGIDSESEAKEFVESVRKKNSLATHNCYAYIADEKGLVQKFSDDGEPQGTAGLPMLEVLKNQKIYKTVAVVTRYFGGIKLGTGGLCRAYSGAVCECLKKCVVKTNKPARFFVLKTDYAGYAKVLPVVKGKAVIAGTKFSDGVKVNLVADENSAESFILALTDTLQGNLDLTETKRGYYSFDKNS